MNITHIAKELKVIEDALSGLINLIQDFGIEVNAVNVQFPILHDKIHPGPFPPHKVKISFDLCVTGVHTTETKTFSKGDKIE